jgi:hypothetical protein
LKVGEWGASRARFCCSHQLLAALPLPGPRHARTCWPNFMVPTAAADGGGIRCTAAPTRSRAPEKARSLAWGLGHVRGRARGTHLDTSHMPQLTLPSAVYPPANLDAQTCKPHACSRSTDTTLPWRHAHLRQLDASGLDGALAGLDALQRRDCGVDDLGEGVDLGGDHRVHLSARARRVTGPGDVMPQGRTRPPRLRIPAPHCGRRDSPERLPASSSLPTPHPAPGPAPARTWPLTMPSAVVYTPNEPCMRRLMSSPVRPATSTASAVAAPAVAARAEAKPTTSSTCYVCREVGVRLGGPWR